MIPKRIQRKRTKGWRMPPNTVYVGHPTKWGNPFLGSHAAQWFYRWLTIEGRIHQDTFDLLPIGMFYKYKTARYSDRKKLLDNIHELKGKDLACWCPLDQPCHADVLLKLANER